MKTDPKNKKRRTSKFWHGERCEYCGEALIEKRVDLDALSYYYDHREEIEQVILESTEDHWMKQTAGEGWRR